jgi:pyruvate/2-oxoacid:ferredoxin oxidoreductase alpha subunit
MEAVALPDEVKKTPRYDWALYADKESRSNLISSILMNTELLSNHNWKLDEKYKKVEREFTEWEEYETDDAEHLFVAIGVCARICLSALHALRKKNIKAGLLRPKTIFPFPSKRLYELGQKIKSTVVVELNNGQMADDVALAMQCAVPVRRYNWMGGKVPSTQEIIDRAEKDLRG